MTKWGSHDPENVAETVTVSHRGKRGQTESQDFGWTPDSSLEEDLAEYSFISALSGNFLPWRLEKIRYVQRQGTDQESKQAKWVRGRGPG